MKKIMVLGIVCLMLAVLATSSFAKKITQGDFALALAQVLGIEVTTVDQAVASLTAMQIMPGNGWIINQVMTPQMAWDVDAAVQRAVAAGFLKPAQADGAVQTVAAALGLEISPRLLPTERANEGIPPAPIAGQPNDPTFQEASPFTP